MSDLRTAWAGVSASCAAVPCAPWTFGLRAALLAALLSLAAASAAEAQVAINEVLASNAEINVDEDGDSSDWVELVNTSGATIDLAGFSLSDDAANPRKWLFPSLSLGPDANALVWCSGKNRTELPPERLGERNSNLTLDANLVTSEDEWRYLFGPADGGAPPAGWTDADFDDGAWERGLTGIGFANDDDIRTPLERGPGVLLVRREFQFEPGQPNLVLQARYDDGLVAYLNGVRVASDRVPEEELTFATLATGAHSARNVERFDLTPFMDRLVPGRNVLAIAVLNTTPTSADLVFYASLGTVQPPLHTNFKLDAGGEPLVLAGPDGTVYDELLLPPQTSDHSWGRSPDGTGPFLYHLVPTPGEPNEGPAGEKPLLVADTKFDVDRGFFDEPFEVAITTETPGAEIRYTLDGREPTEESGILYTRPVPIAGTTTLRARAFKTDFEPTNIDTQTYVFLDDVVTQTLTSALASGFPRSWGSVAADYGLDPDVVGPSDRFGGAYASTIRDDLASLPVMSIVLETAALFGPSGIYTNSGSEGVAWERPASVELIHPDGTRGFQENCGLRIQGGYFRQPTATRKHSFRLLFKRTYGAAKLRYPFFGEDAVDEFDTITLRAGSNDGYSWDAARLTEQYTRDEFGRQLQRATGNPGGHGTFVHLYLNGLYWGLYNPVERPDRSFSESYVGGDKDEWDSLHDGRATAGDTTRWNETRQVAMEARSSLEAYQRLQGRDLDGTRNPDYPHLMDVPNYVDYLLVNVWGGNWDWPWKNWWAGRDRSATSTGFKFYCWDYENTMGNNRSRSPLGKNALQNDFSSAGEFHQSLRLNPEYRMLFADRAHRLFFNGGVLESEQLIPRYEELAMRVERAIVAESARWGDQHHSVPLTLAEWRTERDWILRTYLPARSDVVMSQLRAAGLYPGVDAPVFTPGGGLVPAGLEVSVTAADGVIHATTDGSDPRLPGGEVSATAFVVSSGSGPTVDRSLRLRARALVDGRWSALNESVFLVDTNVSLRVTELMYHPHEPEDGSRDSDEFEFIELKNIGETPLDLGAITMRGAVEFDFASSAVETLAPGALVLIVENESAFRERYGAGDLPIAGQYVGRLDNAGEEIIIEGELGEPVLSFVYDDAWYAATDGEGSSLVFVDPHLPRERWSDASSWRPSAVVGGTPGADDDPSTFGGLQRPGDATQDGRLTISDAIHVLRFLFTEAPGPLPCEGSAITDGANRALLDVDGDGGVNVTDAVFLLDYMFRRGPAPGSGESCRPILGCADACRG